MKVQRLAVLLWAFICVVSARQEPELDEEIQKWEDYKVSESN